MTPEQKRSMLYDFRNRIVNATNGVFDPTDEDALLRIGRELNALDPSLVAELDKMMGGQSLEELFKSELSGAELSSVRDAFYPSTAAKPAPASDSSTLDAPAAETSVEESAPQQNQVFMEEPTNRLAVSQQPALRTDPRVTRPGDITKRNLRRELIADEAAATRTDMFNDRRQRRIDDIFDSSEADIAEAWVRSPTGRRDGRKLSELDPETKQEMRNRFIDKRENMATPSMDDPGLRGPRGDQGAPGPAGPSADPGMPPGVVDMDKQYGRYKNSAGLIMESKMPLDVMRQYREDRAKNPLAAQNYLNSINPVTKEREARMNELEGTRQERLALQQGEQIQAQDLDEPSKPIESTEPSSSEMPPGVVDMDKEYGRYKNPAGLIVESRMPPEVMRQYREDRVRNPLAAQNYLNSINPVTVERQARMDELLDAREARQNQGASDSPQPSTVQPNLDDPKPMQGPQQPAPMQGPNPMSDQDMYDMMDQATAPKAPKGPTQGPPQDDFRAEQYIEKEMAKSGPDMQNFSRSTTVPNPNYDYSTRNNKPSPQFVPVYGKSGYMGYTEGRDGRFVQAPKGFDQKRHFNAVNLAAFENRKQQQMERQARRGAMKNPFTFVDTNPDSDNFLKEYQYNRARDEKRREYNGTFNPYT